MFLELDPWDPDEAGAISVSSYFRLFEDVAGTLSQQKRIRLLRSKMRGTAKQFMIDNMGLYEGENPYLHMKQAMVQWYERDNPGKAAASLCTIRKQPNETLRQFAEKVRQLAQVAVQEEGAELNAAQKVQWPAAENGIPDGALTDVPFGTVEQPRPITPLKIEEIGQDIDHEWGMMMDEEEPEIESPQCPPVAMPDPTKVLVPNHPTEVLVPSHPTPETSSTTVSSPYNLRPREIKDYKKLHKKGYLLSVGVEDETDGEDIETEKPEALDDIQNREQKPQKRYCRAPNCDASSDSEKLFQSPPDPVRLQIWKDRVGLDEPVKMFYICRRHFSTRSFKTVQRTTLLRHAVPSYRSGPLNPLTGDYSGTPPSELGETIPLAQLPPALMGVTGTSSLLQISTSHQIHQSGIQQNEGLPSSTKSPVVDSVTVEIEDDKLPGSTSQATDVGYVKSPTLQHLDNVDGNTYSYRPDLEGTSGSSKGNSILRLIGETRYSSLTPRKQKLVQEVRKQRKSLGVIRKSLKSKSLRLQSLEKSNRDDIALVERFASSMSLPVANLVYAQIFTLFDPPHLLKCTRNMFVKHDLSIQTDIYLNGQKATMTARWQDIIDAYDDDCLNLTRSMHKITRDHLEPKHQKSMKVNLAAQIFSRSVTATLETCVRHGILQQRASTTAEVTRFFNDLFDSLNGYRETPEGGGVGLRCRVQRSREEMHLNFWSAALEKLQSLKFLPKSPTSPPCSTVTIQGWIRSVNAVQLLWTTLKEEIPFDKCSYLVPRRLNQDPLENLFGSIRSKCGSNVNPSAYQFTSALKTCLVNKLADDDLNKGNCEGDVQPQEILESLQRFLVPSANPEGREPVPASNSSLPTNYSDSFAVPRQVIVRQDCTGHRGISCAYVCGFSVSRLLGKHSCEQCRIGLVAASHQEYEALSLIEQREFSTATSGLSYPSRSIFVMFDHGLKLTHEVLERESYSCNIRQCIIALLSKELDFAWWQNHCPEHTNHIFEAITVSLCRIYIPWWCKCRNRAAKSARRELYSKKLMILQHQ
ncbi:hypothetical protein GE061_001837 [Apolygus lucorum]|uniref:THAP-type domain-containing protein n=1 Tax=Apolygus lucorum TaxID=248454 RepID=A0A8S9X612_APOLU|nr:hypothetical protein GE061_001837 [Apolygus lucorum]